MNWFRRTPKPPPEYAVRVETVKRSFGSGDRRVEVLKGVDLLVRAGELIALYGPSGSGKTTLLNLIGALDLPTAGKVIVDDQDLARLSQRKRSRLRRRKIGFIFQNNTLIETYSALENIDLALRLPGYGYFERRKRARTALEAVGLSAWADHVPDELSGGQRQRVAIARALALRPPLILADEPTSGLDTRTARRVLKLFRGVASAQHTAFIIVSHDPLIEQFVDTAYDLREGQLIRRVTPIITPMKIPEGESLP
ncbi:MAG: ABC transporter ATP-binding protein [Anaerolineae bacterium]|jgi:putative ABC transport system ATP-binding protein|nr:ABC transporter ATP-binding protein [Anaerolineae bacterium]